MAKNTFIYIVIIILVIVAVWFFGRKAKIASDNPDLKILADSEEKIKKPSVPVGGEESGGEEKWSKLPNGLQVLDIAVGSGQEAKEGDSVFAHYVGTLADGRKFDSSYDRGQPFNFILGGGMVIKGWDLGLIGMKVGGKRKLIIPPDLAYGDKEVGGGIIPANSTLYFEIELMAVQTPGEAVQ